MKNIVDMDEWRDFKGKSKGGWIKNRKLYVVMNVKCGK